MPVPEASLSRAEQLLHQSRFEEAASILRQMLELDPSQPAQASYLLGCALFQLGRTEEAIQALEAAPARSGLAEHKSALATVLFHLGRDEEAERNLRMAIALDTSGPHYHSGLPTFNR